MSLVPAPCSLRDGRLVLDELPLDELVAHAEGRPLWLIGKAALERCWSGAPALVPVAAFGSLELLEGAAAAGHWARAAGEHDLRAAAAAGFPAGRTVLAGDVLDDGALKEALLAGVAVVPGAALDDGPAPRPSPALDVGERASRIAGLLGLDPPVTPDDVPAPLRPSRLDGCGLLLVGVLDAGDRHLALDAPLDPRWCDGPLEVFALGGGAPRPVQVAGLSGAPDLLERLSLVGPAARLHGTVARGEWVAIPTRRALLGARPDPSHGEPERLLVSGVHARPMAPAPPPPPAGRD